MGCQNFDVIVLDKRKKKNNSYVQIKEDEIYFCSLHNVLYMFYVLLLFKLMGQLVVEGSSMV